MKVMLDACLEKVKANPEKTNAGLQETQFESEEQEVTEEQTAVDTVGAM
jgi:hypothetical protein